MEKHFIFRITFLFQYMFGHFHTMLPQNPDAFSMYQRVWILRPNHHPADSGGKQGIGTRRLFSVVAARLQCDINGCPFGRFGTMCQRIPLRVGFAVPLMPALSDDRAVLTITAPTMGLGAVQPRPRSASTKARRIDSTSFIPLPPKEKALNESFRARRKDTREAVDKVVNSPQR